MTSDVHDRETLGAYAFGALTDEDRRAVEAHVSDCQSCRDELSQLAHTVAALDEVPPEMFMDGPPEGGDLVLQRALATARREGASRRRSRRVAVAAAVAASLLAAASGGVALGRSDARNDLVLSPPPVGTPPVPVPASGTRTESGVDPATGSRLTVTLTPAAGWVRVNAAAAGIPAGQRCRLWVVDRDGGRQLAASWLVSAKGAEEGTTLDGAAIVPPDRVAAVEVNNFTGRTFVSVPF